MDLQDQSPYLFSFSCVFYANNNNNNNNNNSFLSLFVLYIKLCVEVLLLQRSELRRSRKECRE
ncbi:MAG: hypothetical protein N7Q72_07415, partial [Spiroplasma sp. Tabriz.8]|nr:hypothetical protein [Candidatus Regiella insecticola]MCZ8633075.1 hypothetical protein [Spiroplasma sp. Tabriz.8]